MVQNWIEDGRDLTHFTRDDLQDVSSWAMVTEDRIPAIDLFRQVKPETVQPHTDRSVTKFVSTSGK
ncbi:hypothetical protein N9267_00855 [bacterium]|nr:hypothetical protein [bacterium]